MEQSYQPDELREAFAAAMDVRSEGEHGYRLHLPVYYSNGDDLTIRLRPVGDGWELSDGGDTLFNAAPDWDERSELVAQPWLQIVLLNYRMEETEEEFRKHSEAASLGRSILEFASALLEVDRGLAWRERGSTDPNGDDVNLLRKSLKLARHEHFIAGTD